MIQQLLFCFVMAIMTVAIHAMGTVYVVIPVARVWTGQAGSADSPRTVWTLIRLVSLLLVLHLVEMAVWAAGYTVAANYGGNDEAATSACGYST